MARLLYRLGAGAVRHRLAVVLVWLAVARVPSFRDYDALNPQP